MAFTPRLTAPSRTIPVYLCTSSQQISRYGRVVTSGGLNECIVGNNSQDGSAMPNCVGYAWGRWYEILGSRPNLSRANANVWYTTSDGYVHRTTNPTAGSVVCFSSQHVGIIERIISNTECLVSNSYWTQKVDFHLEKIIYNSSTSTWERWNCSQTSPYTTTSKLPSGNQGFQGFIILPITDPDNTLNNIHVEGVSIGFEPDVLEYTATTYYNYTALIVTPKYADQVITRYINGIVVIDSQVAYLNEGANTLFVFCRRTVEGVNYYTQYKITLYYGVVPPSERDANIANINIQGTDFEDSFSEFNYDYSYNLTGESNRMMVIPNDSDAYIIVTFNGELLPFEQGIFTGVMNWVAGENTIVIDSVIIDGTTVYQKTYYITIYSATNIELISFNFYKDSAKTQMVEIIPEFNTDIVDYTAKIKEIYKLYLNYLLEDTRSWASVYVNGVLYSGAQYSGIDLRKGKNTVQVLASGYSYDGRTVVFNTYTFIITVLYKTFNIIYSTRLL